MTLLGDRQPRWWRSPATAAGLLGLLAYVSLAGADTLWPSHIDWLQVGDWSQTFLAWSYFRDADWSLPLGFLPALGKPVGTWLAMMDGVPWLALAGKLLSPWLPHPCQWTGPMMALNFAMSGIVGAWLCGLYVNPWLARAAGGALFVWSPALLARVRHPSLTAHWLVLLGLWLCLRPVAEGRRQSRLALGLLLLAEGIHPYLAAIVAPLCALASCRGILWTPPAERPRRALEAAAGMGMLLTVVPWALGYVQPGFDPPQEAYGSFSADLSSLFNPVGGSTWLPSMPVRLEQLEGYGYLGAGVMLLLATTAVAVGHAGRARIDWPGGLRGPWPWVFGVALCSASFAVSWLPSLWGQPLVDWSPPPGAARRLANALPASGRFIWPLVYALPLAALAALRRCLQQDVLARVVVVAAFVQWLEVVPNQAQERFAERHFLALHDPLWRDMGADYDDVILLPPIFDYHQARCDALTVRPGAQTPFSFAAVRAGMSINSAYSARNDGEAISRACSHLKQQLQQGRVSGRAVYVVLPPAVEWVQGLAEKLRCAAVDGVAVCVRLQNDDPVARRLMRIANG